MFLNYDHLKYMPEQLAFITVVRSVYVIPDNKVHGANMGPIWVLSAPDGP